MPCYAAAGSLQSKSIFYQKPIREATNRLIVARAIEALPRRSLRVPEAAVARLDSLLPLRLHLESEATRLAVEAGCKPLAAKL